MARPEVSRAAIVSVGNELLYGHTVDTNAAWLGRVLAERGIPVVWRCTVGDVDADILDAFDAARARADLVLVSGGLGPTPDDRTKPVIAAHLGRPLVPDEAARRGGSSPTRTPCSAVGSCSVCSPATASSGATGPLGGRAQSRSSSEPGDR